MEADDFSCVVCKERYRDDRLPRSLVCGHTLCSACVQQLINTHSLCPECRHRITANTVDKLTVNYALLRLAKNLPHHQPPEQPNAGPCRAHGALTFFYCVSCTAYICHHCTIVNHKALPSGTCDIVSVADALEKKKSKQTQALIAKTDILNSLKKELNTTSGHLQEIRSLHAVKREYYRHKMEAEDTKVQSLRAETLEAQQQQRELSRLVEQVRLAREDVPGATTVVDVEATITAADHVMATVDSFTSRTHHLVEQLSTTTFDGSLVSVTDRKDMKKLLELRHANIYGVREREGRQECSQLIRRRNNRCHLRALQPGPPPPYALTVPWEWLRQLVPESTMFNSNIPNTFLDIDLAGQPRGRVYIRVCESDGAQFKMLCTGERGHSYRGSTFHSDSYLHFTVSGCVNTDGSPLAHVSAAASDILDYSDCVSPGELSRSSTSDPTSFHIWTEKFDDGIPGVFGHVTSGLDVIRGLRPLTPISGIKIADCGCVFDV